MDRLGRNYEDVCDTIREFMRRGIVIRTVINNLTFDGATKDPIQQAVRDALIAFMAATAQAQAEATKAAQRAGIEHAKQNDHRAYLGRKPSYTRDQFDKVRALLGQQAVDIAQIAMETGLTRQTVYRIKDDLAGAEAALVVWGCEGTAFGRDVDVHATINPTVRLMQNGTKLKQYPLALLERSLIRRFPPPALSAG